MTDSDDTAPGPSSLGLAAALAGFVLWALLGAIPLYLALSRSRTLAGNEIALVFATLGLAALLSLGPVSRARPAYAVFLAFAAFPTALALEGIALGVRSVAHFDPPTRWLAALTAAAYVCIGSLWSGGLPRALPSATARASTTPANAKNTRAHSSSNARRLPLRRIAPTVLLGVASLLGVVLPSLVSHEAASTTRASGALLSRARDALSAAGGLAVALLLLLSAGSSLVRAGPPQGSTRRTDRAIVLLLVAATVGLLLVLLRRAR